MDLNFEQINALIAVSNEGAFSKAAKVLRITQPAVSERIRLLEEKLGLPLLVRKVPVELTEAGCKLIAYANQVSVLEAAVLQSLSLRQPSSEKRALIPIAVNFDSLATWFSLALCDFNALGVARLEIISDDQTLTRNLLADGRVLGCVSSESHTVPGCLVESLGKMRYVCVCEPNLKRSAFSKGKDIESFAKVPAIIYGRNDKLHDDWLKKISGDSRPIEPQYFYVPHIVAMKQMVLAGNSYALLPEVFIQEELESGILVQLREKTYVDVELFWHVNSIETPVLKKLSSIVKNAASKLR
ncbi:MAG: ArgP/LysG family DNA-binding transcriptional regulator [Proteobacteria bacterium]|nr:ArgP/LysG family DNA-binding transcriptional regulator [Pseudomonadota bacterium]